MELFQHIDISVISMVVLGSVYAIARKRLDRRDELNRIFLRISRLILIEVFLEAVSYIIDRRPSVFLAYLSVLLNTCLFVIAPLIPYYWLIFIHRWVLPDKPVSRRKMALLLAPIIVNIALAVVSPFTGLFFTVSGTNEYNRGPLFIMPALMAFIYLLFSMYVMLKNRQKVLEGTLPPVLIFGLFPVAAGIVEMTSYGELVFWGCTALAFSIVFIFIQQRMMQHDPLTGAWTRGTFDQYVNQHIGHQKYGVVFIDLDGFKKVNDTYGHIEGDFALKQTVNLICQSLRKSDIVARFGGDEFVLLLDTASMDEIKKIMIRIQDNFTEYNKNSHRPYALKYSMGYDVFDPERHDIEQFLNHVDNLMYQNKGKKRAQHKPSRAADGEAV